MVSDSVLTSVLRDDLSLIYQNTLLLGHVVDDLLLQELLHALLMCLVLVRCHLLWHHVLSGDVVSVLGWKLG